MRPWLRALCASASVTRTPRRISMHSWRPGSGSRRRRPRFNLQLDREDEQAHMNTMKNANTNLDNRPKLPVYLDYQATTPCDPRVVQAMLPYFTEKFGNPHSRNHSYGWDAEEGVEKARKQVADLVGADEKEIIFTSGATESNDLALKGVAHFYKDRK